MQLLATEYTSTLSVPSLGVNSGQIERLKKEAIAKALSGEISRDVQSVYRYMLEQWAADVDRYFTPANPTRTVDAKVTGTCTGWWVTQDGYMVTGAHCVKPDQKELAQTFAKQALDQVNKKDVADLVKIITKNAGPTDENIKRATSIIVQFNAKHLKIGEVKQETAVLQSIQGGGVDKTAKELPAEIVAAGESYPGKDVAILKVNGQQNLPTLELGADADVNVGDTFYIDGFPGTVTTNGSLSIDSRLQPTFTQGPYNAQRSTQNGVPYFQTQAPAYGGNSGGPVFSDTGRVVGILIAGLNSSDGQSAQNQQLVLPVSVVKEKLNEKNVKPAVSNTAVTYNAALDSFYKKHYKKALPKFREVQALNPGHPYVAKFVADSQAAISAGKDKTPTPITTWLIIGGAAFAAVVIVLLLVLLLRRRSRRGQPGRGGDAFGPPLLSPGMGNGAPGDPFGNQQPAQPAYPGGPPGPSGPGMHSGPPMTPGNQMAPPPQPGGQAPQPPPWPGA